ncbi:MAG TPA: futalosine hydrolase [Flavisolibacter sp.]|nr:futalosine hydrolase [Flavisolibacter sp.]
MQILLCAATDFEISETIAYIRDQKLSSISVLITGIGMTSATYSLTKAVLSNKPDLIIQAGIGGALDNKLTLSSVWVIEQDMFGDLGVKEQEQFLNLFDMNFLQENSFPWQKGRLRNKLEYLPDQQLPKIDGVTVNEITTHPDRIRYYKNEGAGIESMEGAALHYVGLMEKVPFLQIRSISNYVGERDKSKWQLRKSITELNRELQTLLLKLLKQ